MEAIILINNTVRRQRREYINRIQKVYLETLILKSRFIHGINYILIVKNDNILTGAVIVVHKTVDISDLFLRIYNQQYNLFSFAKLIKINFYFGAQHFAIKS